MVDEIVDDAGVYRHCDIRGPEGILLGLAQALEGPGSGWNPAEREP